MRIPEGVVMDIRDKALLVVAVPALILAGFLFGWGMHGLMMGCGA